MGDEGSLAVAINELLDDVHNGLPPRDAMPRVRELIGDYAAEAARLRGALVEIDNLNPEDFKSGQEHLAKWARTVDFKEAFRAVARIVNGVLHGTDEDGKPLTEGETIDGSA